jgi:amino-acid N-acetyltransferase
METVKIRKAVLADAQPILELVNELALRQIMLPRSPGSVIENIRDFVIAEEGGRFVGCGALHVVWADLAEIRSIAVAPEQQKRGFGRLMAERLIEEARELGVARLFAFTYSPGFFGVEHASLPHKVFGDCRNCPKFLACDEIAMQRVLDPAAVAPGGFARASDLMLPRLAR